MKHNYAKYEYMTSTITNEAGLELDKLNKLGKLGWELVAVVDKVTFPFHRGYHILYFKRVIEATAPSAKRNKILSPHDKQYLSVKDHRLGDKDEQNTLHRNVAQQ